MPGAGATKAEPLLIIIGFGGIGRGEWYVSCKGIDKREWVIER
jgi:hypothetical protein